MSTPDDASTLIDLMVGAYEPYVTRIAAERGYAVEGLRDAIAAGQEWLGSELAAQLQLPFERQTRGPLEVFQEAMRFPTAALRGAGHDAVVRDDVALRALPGDVYDLAPPSSQVLGDEVWQAHLAWGASKAAAFTLSMRPRIGVYTRNLMDQSRFEGPGHEVVVWKQPDAIESPPRRCFVDLTSDGADDAIRTLAEAGARVVAFGPHVDDLAMVRARSLGAEDALARSVFFRRLPEMLPNLA